MQLIELNLGEAGFRDMQGIERMNDIVESYSAKMRGFLSNLNDAAILEIVGKLRQESVDKREDNNKFDSITSSIEEFGVLKEGIKPVLEGLIASVGKAIFDDIENHRSSIGEVLNAVHDQLFYALRSNKMDDTARGEAIQRDLQFIKAGLQYIGENSALQQIVQENEEVRGVIDRIFSNRLDKMGYYDLNIANFRKVTGIDPKTVFSGVIDRAVHYAQEENFNAVKVMYTAAAVPGYYAKAEVIMSAAYQSVNDRLATHAPEIDNLSRKEGKSSWLKKIQDAGKYIISR